MADIYDIVGEHNAPQFRLTATTASAASTPKKMC